MKKRIYFLDNFRTFLILLVVVLHSGLVYETIFENVWIVSDPLKNSSIALIRMYLDIFVMFSIFFVSGYFISNSVKSKTNKEFFMSKFRRIMIPWLVAVFTLIPAYKIIFLYSRDLPQQAWYSYFHIFQRSGTDLSVFSNNPTQNWLWFLPILFLFQTIYWLLSKANMSSCRITFKGAVISSIIIGLIYSLIISEMGLKGWFDSSLLHFQRERLLIYFMSFLLGSLCYKLKVFETANRNKSLYIWANVVLTISLTLFTAVALNFFFNMIEAGREFYFVSNFFDRILYYASMLLSMFSFLYIFIYVFRFNFNKTNKLMNELNKNSYAVYINHMIVMGVIALVLLNISIPALLKFLILTVLTFIVTNGLVYAYRKTIQDSLRKPILMYLSIFSALLITITVYVKQGDCNNNIESSNTSNSEILAPTTGLHMAVIKGDLAIVKQHIVFGSDLNIIEPSGGSSPLISAALFGQTDIALALIDASANLNFQNNEGSTALHTAAFFCQVEIVEALLAKGADKNIKNKSGSIAIDGVSVPFADVKGIYDYFEATLGPLGLVLDLGYIEKTRPIIVEVLQEN